MTQPPAGYPSPDSDRPPGPYGDRSERQAPPEYELPPRYGRPAGQEQPRYEHEYGPPAGATDPYGQPPVSGSHPRRYDDRPPYEQPPAGPPYRQPPPGPPYPPPPYGRAPQQQPPGYGQPAPPGPHHPPYDRTSAGAPYHPGGPPVEPTPPYGATGGPPPRRPRRLLLVATAVTGVLVLCSGVSTGAWLIFRDGDRNGADTPAAAVQSFLQAVYGDKDPRQAAALVCSEARDESSLQVKINEIAAYEGTEVNPTFQWTDPQVIEQTGEVALVEVTITMITADERVADQTMHVSVLDKEPHGWWVCNLETVGPPADEDGEEGSDGDQDGAAEDGAEEGSDGG